MKTFWKVLFATAFALSLATGCVEDPVGDAADSFLDDMERQEEAELWLKCEATPDAGGCPTTDDAQRERVPHTQAEVEHACEVLCSRLEDQYCWVRCNNIMIELLVCE